MKALVFNKVGDIRLQEVAEPKLEKPKDAIIRLTASAICGTDLHFVRGTVPGMQSGTTLGHEGVGVVEEIGSEVKEIQVGDRVVVCSTIGCGECERCQNEDYSQCIVANPNGKYSGTAFFGGPKASGSFHGLQAEKARIPFADTVLVKLPPEVSDEQAILISDIFPTAYYGADLAKVQPGKTVAVFGCGPVGLFAILSAQLMGAKHVFAVDTIPSRLRAAKELGADPIDYNQEDPVEKLKEVTQGAGVDCVIDAVGVDANHAHDGPASKAASELKSEFKQELKKAVPHSHPHGKNWIPGDAPTQALRWGVDCLRAAGHMGIIGVYSPLVDHFPIGIAMNKNITVSMGNCPHRKYIPKLVELVKSGKVDPMQVLSHVKPLSSVVQAYEEFDKRSDGWIKVELNPAR